MRNAFFQKIDGLMQYWIFYYSAEIWPDRTDVGMWLYSVCSCTKAGKFSLSLLWREFFSFPPLALPTWEPPQVPGPRSLPGDAISFEKGAYWTHRLVRPYLPISPFPVNHPVRQTQSCPHSLTISHIDRTSSPWDRLKRFLHIYRHAGKVRSV